ncbi:MAG: hypothetical protein ACR2MS_12950 [Weeksellaceae bacterium]
MQNKENAALNNAEKQQNIEENPIEMLSKQIEELFHLNKSLLDFYSDGTEKISKKMEGVSQSFLDKFHTQNKQLEESLRRYIQSLKPVPLIIPKEEKQYLHNFERKLEMFAKHKYHFLWMLIIPLVFAVITGYLAVNFYKTSVLTKTEARNEFIEQVKLNGDIITSKAKLSALDNEKLILSAFLKKEKEFSRAYNLFRDGVMESHQESTFFQSPTSDKITE